MNRTVLTVLGIESMRARGCCYQARFNCHYKEKADEDAKSRLGRAIGGPEGKHKSSMPDPEEARCAQG